MNKRQRKKALKKFAKSAELKAFFEILYHVSEQMRLDKMGFPTGGMVLGECKPELMMRHDIKSTEKCKITLDGKELI